ncbi:hypothetical protein MW368_003693 [Acinetobacter baumannii]|nr:hypothetical protein [Acinetobacter baumannii]
MAASIELYDQAGTLIFDSSQPRILRLKGDEPITWTYDYAQQIVGDSFLFFFKGTFTNLPGWSMFNTYVLSADMGIRKDYLVRGVYGRRGNDPETLKPQLPQSARVLRY